MMLSWQRNIVTAILDGKLDSVPGIAQSVASQEEPTPPAGPSGTSPESTAQTVSQTEQQTPTPTSQEPETVAVAEPAPVEKGKETILTEGFQTFQFQWKPWVRTRDILNISRCWRWESPCRWGQSWPQCVLTGCCRLWRTRWPWRDWTAPCWTALTTRPRL